MHDADAGGLGFARAVIVPAPGLSPNGEAPLVGNRDAAQNTHQGALARTIAADEADDLAKPDRQVDALVGQGGTVSLGDAGKRDERLRLSRRCLLPRQWHHVHRSCHPQTFKLHGRGWARSRERADRPAPSRGIIS
jgi:hypothetical protein